jgi:hypothetical protein
MRLMQAQAETYNLCGLSYFTGCGLRPIAGVTLVAVLTVGLVTAPMPQLISAVALQQQASAPDKKTKMKKAKC